MFRLALLLTPLFLSAGTSANPLTVSGTLTFPKTGPIYLQLVTQKEFETESEGQYALTLADDTSPVDFLFNEVTPGSYMIRSFQDVNENGELDMGLFGPKEPWLILNYKPSPFKRPSFDEHSVIIEQDTTLDLNLIP